MTCERWEMRWVVVCTKMLQMQVSLQPKLFLVTFRGATDVATSYHSTHMKARSSRSGISQHLRNTIDCLHFLKHIIYWHNYICQSLIWHLQWNCGMSVILSWSWKTSILVAQDIFPETNTAAKRLTRFSLSASLRTPVFKFRNLAAMNGMMFWRFFVENRLGDFLVKILMPGRFAKPASWRKASLGSSISDPDRQFFTIRSKKFPWRNQISSPFLDQFHPPFTQKRHYQKWRKWDRHIQKKIVCQIMRRLFIHYSFLPKKKTSEWKRGVSHTFPGCTRVSLFQSISGWWLFPKPSEKYATVKMGSSSPRFGVKISKILWNHHLFWGAFFCFSKNSNISQGTKTNNIPPKQRK